MHRTTGNSGGTTRRTRGIARRPLFTQALTYLFVEDRAEGVRGARFLEEPETGRAHDKLLAFDHPRVPAHEHPNSLRTPLRHQGEELAALHPRQLLIANHSVVGFCLEQLPCEFRGECGRDHVAIARQYSTDSREAIDVIVNDQRRPFHTPWGPRKTPSRRQTPSHQLSTEPWPLPGQRPQPVGVTARRGASQASLFDTDGVGDNPPKSDAVVASSLRCKRGQEGRIYRV